MIAAKQASLEGMLTVLASLVPALVVERSDYGQVVGIANPPTRRATFLRFGKHFVREGVAERDIASWVTQPLTARITPRAELFQFLDVGEPHADD